MPEILEDSQQTLESTTIWVNRTAATVKGGRRFSFCALVAVGNRGGQVGLGYGKAPGVPAAIEKAQKEAKKKLQKVVLNRGTITHESTGRFCSSKVRLIPASPGTGVIAGGTVRAVLELAGIRDCLTKSYGSNNKINLARATLAGLLGLRTRQAIADLRGVEIDHTVVDEKIELGERYAPSGGGEGSERAKAPVNELDEQARSSRGRGKGGRGRGGGGGGRGRSRGGRDQQQPQQPEQSLQSQDTSGGDAGGQATDADKQAPSQADVQNQADQAGRQQAEPQGEQQGEQTNQ
jgi:small subunit ribosomal protein S5